MATTAPIPARRPVSRSRLTASVGANDTLRRRALEVLTKAIAKAVESASEDTLADIVGSDADPRHALSVARRDIAPDSPSDLDAIKAARDKTARVREEMADRAGGMLDRAHVATMLGVSAAAIDKQRQRRQILGVPYGTETRYPAAQFVDGETVSSLKLVLEALGDMNPWEQLMLLTTPLDGYGEQSETMLQLLAKRPDAGALRQLVALASSWSA
ncbi:hypothetical protein D0Z70_20470 [Sphingobium terrigena]|uniref:DNA-binding protein n=1 Tax=Sphingobium terrigena TaxID=2304063 RepID=A0A418YML4_9SPHN|nr:hypothetical protein D0Z70_20470 [Sphingobium terrigena]